MDITIPKEWWKFSNLFQVFELAKKKNLSYKFHQTILNDNLFKKMPDTEKKIISVKRQSTITNLWNLNLEEESQVRYYPLIDWRFLSRLVRFHVESMFPLHRESQITVYRISLHPKLNLDNIPSEPISDILDDVISKKKTFRSLKRKKKRATSSIKSKFVMMNCQNSKKFHWMQPFRILFWHSNIPNNVEWEYWEGKTTVKMRRFLLI